MTPEELDAYLERVGHRGWRAPTKATLDALMLAHTTAIPFENLDVLAGRPISLAPEAVFDKLVRRRRGGYCFEQNGLFARVLEALGYRVRPLAARARVGRARSELPPRTHLCLEVTIGDRRHLVDVGVGGLSLTAALSFDDGAVQQTPHEPRRLVHESGGWWHQAWLGDRWTDVAELTGEPMPPIDQEIGSWWTSAHPGSPFRAELMVARALDRGGRLTLRGDVLTLRAEGFVERATVPAEALPAVLEARFGLVQSKVHTRRATSGRLREPSVVPTAT